MKQAIKYIITILLLLLAVLPLISFLWCVLQPKKKMNFLILDKTVLLPNSQEHSSVNWVLAQNSITTSEGNSYDKRRDYFGFIPDGDGHYSINDFNDMTPIELDSIALRYDAVYYTDTYGVYQSEWESTYGSLDPPHMLSRVAERSSLIYGGLTPKEVSLLSKMKRLNKLIITEFNLVASPTSSHVRRLFEREFSVRWSGWVGRYFETLDTNKNKELPMWLKRNYKSQNRGKWPFTHPGIAFVRDDDRLVILELHTHLKTEVPQIITDSVFMKEYDLPHQMKYSFWFDICSTKEPNCVISHYNIDVNALGDSVLKLNRIPKRFPAIIANRRSYPFYYFAGDFADNPISTTTSYFKHIDLISGVMYQPSSQERNSFFWKFYRPLLQNILNNYYEYKSRR